MSTNPRDALRKKSMSPKIVLFHALGMMQYYSMEILFIPVFSHPLHFLILCIFFLNLFLLPPASCIHRRHQSFTDQNYKISRISPSTKAAIALQPPSPFNIISQPESWYSFTIPRRVEGWVDLGTTGKVHTARAQGCKLQLLLLR